MIEVVCAIILKDDKILAVQRSSSMLLPLKWEFAMLILDKLKIRPHNKLNMVNEPQLSGIVNLNAIKLRKFDNPPIKNMIAKFRKHSVKDENMTVTLTNYDFVNKGKVNGKWNTSLKYGTGKGYPSQSIHDFFMKI